MKRWRLECLPAVLEPARIEATGGALAGKKTLAHRRIGRCRPESVKLLRGSARAATGRRRADTRPAARRSSVPTCARARDFGPLPQGRLAVAGAARAPGPHRRTPG